jgi:hypothetical protein
MTKMIAIDHCMAIAIAIALALAGGCSSPTQMLVEIDNAGVRVPADVDSLHIRIGTDDAVSYENTLPICTGAGSAGCYPLPLRLLLIPGPLEPQAVVTVLAEARAADRPVIADSARFRFASGQTLRMTFALYSRCLGNTMCAATGRTCGDDGTCQTPMINGAPPDLGMLPEGGAPTDARPGVDLAMPPDGPGGPDLSITPQPDLSITPQPDLSITPQLDLSTKPSGDLSCGDLGEPCCDGSWCNNGYTCHPVLMVCGVFPGT